MPGVTAQCWSGLSVPIFASDNVETQPLDFFEAAAAAALVPASPPPRSGGESASPETKRAQFQNLVVLSDDSPMNSEDFCPEHPKLPRGASPQRDSQQQEPLGHDSSDGMCPSEHGSALGAIADAPTPEDAPSKVGYIKNCFIAVAVCYIAFSTIITTLDPCKQNMVAKQ